LLLERHRSVGAGTAALREEFPEIWKFLHCDTAAGPHSACIYLMGNGLLRQTMALFLLVI